MRLAENFLFQDSVYIKVGLLKFRQICMVTHLIYRSFSETPLSERQLQLILEKSQANNSLNEITGLLLYRNNTFIQLLEGPEKQVLSCMQRIRKDTRHYGSSVIFLATSEERLFPNWSMSHIPQKKIIKPLDTITTVVENTMKLNLPPRGTLLTILKSFVAPEYLQAASGIKFKKTT